MKDSKNPYLLSNQGIDYYETQSYGKAIAALYQAKKALPRNKEIRTNLRIIEDEIQLKQPVLITYNLMNFSEALILLFVFNVLFVFRKLITKNHALQFAIAVAFITALAIATVVGIEQKVQKYGVVIEQSVKAYSGDNENDQELFELLDGQIVRIVHKEKKWSQIAYGNKLGWVKNTKLSKI